MRPQFWNVDMSQTSGGQATCPVLIKHNALPVFVDFHNLILESKYILFICVLFHYLIFTPSPMVFFFFTFICFLNILRIATQIVVSGQEIVYLL